MKKKIISIVLAVVLFIGVAFTAYTQSYYHVAEDTAWETKENVSIVYDKQGYYFDGPNEDDILIFYPGGKVEEEAYIPLLLEVAEEMDVFLVSMPFRLAFFGINRADPLVHEFQGREIYIGGHSLGGAMAAYYASSHQDELEGVILFAAYPTKDLGDLKLLSIVGSEDKVVNQKKIEEGKQYVKNGTYIVLDGGNHGQFGDYGFQKGDGQSTITNKAQWQFTAQEIGKWLDEGR